MILRKMCKMTRTTLCKAYRTMSSNHQLVLYGDDASPPVRFVRMTSAILNVELEYKHVDLFKGENKSEDYKKINPLQKVPALSIGGTVVCDSHAIALYLCRRFDNNLYAEDHITRAAVDEMLFFHATILFPIDSYILSAYFAKKWPVQKEKIDQWNSALDHLEHKLTGRSWLAGDKMYLCDLCTIATITSMEALIPVTQRHNRVRAWMDQFQNLPCFDVNKQGVGRLCSFIQKKSAH